jgi:SprT protein
MSYRKFPIGDLTDEQVLEMLGIATEAQKAEVEEAITKALNAFEKHFDRSFKRPAVVFDLKGHVAGYANAERIRLNTELLTTHHDDMINRTVPHEVAHVVQRELYPKSKSHGGEWQYLMHILGLPADTTHSYQTTPARVRRREYVYGCDCEPHYVTITLHRRLQQGKVYVCRKCNSQLYFIRKEA